MEQLEQYSRKENVIISGLLTNHKSLSRRASPPDINTDEKMLRNKNWIPSKSTFLGI